MNDLLTPHTTDLTRELEQLRAETRADVVAYYVACDPFVPNCLRRVATLGAAYPEACEYLRPGLLLTGQTQAEFSPHAADSSLRESQPPLVTGLPLFDDFIAREGLLSCGWVGDSLSLLQVGYHTERSEINCRLRFPSSGPVRRAYEAVGQRLTPRLLDMMARMDALWLDAPFLSRLTILPLWKDARRSAGELFADWLGGIVQPLQPDGGAWCGMVHLLDEERQELHRVASVGDGLASDVQVLRLAQGEGVAAWAACRRQPVCVADLAISPFGQIHVPSLPEARSLLAVPLLAQGRLLGTLSLESTEPDGFDPQTAGYLLRAGGLLGATLLRAEALQTQRQRDLYQRALAQQLAKNTHLADLEFPDPAALVPQVSTVLAPAG